MVNPVTKDIVKLVELQRKMHTIFCTESPTKTYRSDLAIDFTTLLSDPSLDYVWAERENGTELFPRLDSKAQERFEYWTPQLIRFHKISLEDYSIVEITPEEAESVVNSWGDSH